MQQIRFNSNTQKTATARKFATGIPVGRAHQRPITTEFQKARKKYAAIKARWQLLTTNLQNKQPVSVYPAWVFFSEQLIVHDPQFTKIAELLSHLNTQVPSEDPANDYTFTLCTVPPKFRTDGQTPIGWIGTPVISSNRGLSPLTSNLMAAAITLRDANVFTKIYRCPTVITEKAGIEWGIPLTFHQLLFFDQYRAHQAKIVEVMTVFGNLLKIQMRFATIATEVSSIKPQIISELVDEYNCDLAEWPTSIPHHFPIPGNIQVSGSGSYSKFITTCFVRYCDTELPPQSDYPECPDWIWITPGLLTKMTEQISKFIGLAAQLDLSLVWENLIQILACQTIHTEPTELKSKTISTLNRIRSNYFPATPPSETLPQRLQRMVTTMGTEIQHWITNSRDIDINRIPPLLDLVTGNRTLQPSCMTWHQYHTDAIDKMRRYTWFGHINQTMDRYPILRKMITQFSPAPLTFKEVVTNFALLDIIVLAFTRLDAVLPKTKNYTTQLSQTIEVVETALELFETQKKDEKMACLVYKLAIQDTKYPITPHPSLAKIAAWTIRQRLIIALLESEQPSSLDTISKMPLFASSIGFQTIVATVHPRLKKPQMVAGIFTLMVRMADFFINHFYKSPFCDQNPINFDILETKTDAAIQLRFSLINTPMDRPYYPKHPWEITIDSYEWVIQSMDSCSFIQPRKEVEAPEWHWEKRPSSTAAQPKKHPTS